MKLKDPGIMMTIISITTTHGAESVFRSVSVAFRLRTFDLVSIGIFITAVTRF
jgi:hypothetical protein